MNPFYEIYIVGSLFFYGTLGLAVVLGLALLAPWMYQQFKCLMGSYRAPSGDRPGLCGYPVRHSDI